MSSVDEELPETLPRWEIPSDWQWVSIADVGKVITGNTPPTKDESNYGNHIPFVKPPALTEKGIRSTPEGLSETGVRSSRTLPAGAVLVSCIGGLGKTGIAKIPVAFNQQINAIVFDQRVIPEFGFYYSQTLKPWLHSVSSATTLPIVNKGKFQRAPFPLAPLDQQKRIVAEIEKQFSRLDEAVANLKRVKANLKRYKAAVLKAAVEGRLVETEAERARREGRCYETGAQLLQRILETRRSQWQGKGKYKEPTAPDTTDLPELPEGWVWAAVSQVADVASGNTPAGILEKVKETGDVPWFKVGDMNHEENQQVMRRADAWLSTSEVKKLALRLFPPSTVLFPKRGGAIATNKKRRLELPGCADLNVMGITPVLELTSYLFTWFDGVNLAKLSDGSNVPQINHKDIEPLLIPLPPLAEQHRIVAEVDRRLSLLLETEAQVDANLQRAARLRQSILARAFSGRLLNDNQTPSTGAASAAGVA